MYAEINGKVIDINKNEPHQASEVVCLKCLKRWVAVRDMKTTLKMLECPECGLTGYTVSTGENLYPSDENNDFVKY